MSVPIAIIRLVPLTRWSSCSGGSSVPVAAAAAARTEATCFDRSLRCLRSGRSSRLSAAGCRYGSASTMASSPRPVRAAATARSSPTISAVLTSSSATSAARRPVAAAPVARLEAVDRHAVAGQHDVVRVEATVGDPGRVQRTDLPPQVGETASVIRAGSASPSRVPVTGRYAISAAPGPAVPATTTGGPHARRRARRAAARRPAPRRLRGGSGARSGPPSLYARNRHDFESSCASASSRPSTRTGSSPSASCANMTVPVRG